MKKSFKLYYDSLDVLSELSDEQAGQLLRAIVKYETEGEEILEGLMKAVFTPFKNNIDRANKAYTDVCERNKANGLKGGRPKAKETHSVILGSEKTHSNPKKADKDKDKDKDTNRTISPFEIIETFKTNVSTDRNKIDEKWTMQELRTIKHNYEEIIKGLVNYGKKAKGTDPIQKLSNFISNRIYLDYQEEQKEKPMNGLLYQGSIYG